MVAYLVNQIVLGNLTYLEVVTARPDLKVKIDTYIEDKNLVINKTV
jgi:hypothetical protein